MSLTLKSRTPLVTASRAAPSSPMLIAAELIVIAIEKSNRGHVHKTRSSNTKNHGGADHRRDQG